MNKPAEMKQLAFISPHKSASRYCADKIGESNESGSRGKIGTPPSMIRSGTFHRQTLLAS
jgi:hypothetical protein